MRTAIRRALGLGVLAVVATLSVVPPAWSDNDRHRDRRTITAIE